MKDIEKKIKKICRKIEKEFGGRSVCGEISKRENVATIPVSIIKEARKNENVSSYNQPVGIIEIRNDDKIRFIPLERKVSYFRDSIRLLTLVLTVFGLRKVFRPERRWEND